MSDTRRRKGVFFRLVTARDDELLMSADCRDSDKIIVKWASPIGRYGPAIVSRKSL